MSKRIAAAVLTAVTALGVAGMATPAEAALIACKFCHR